MDPNTLIAEDTPCGKCRYNLRGLAVTARCPECGYPALRAVVRATVAAERRLHDPAYLESRALQFAARLLRRNVDSLIFVRRACQRAAAQQRGMPLIGTPAPSDAHQLGAHLRELALWHYGSREEAMATFRFWRFERSEDVGEIVFALVEIGLLLAATDGSPADFGGRFTLEELFAAPEAS